MGASGQHRQVRFHALQPSDQVAGRINADLQSSGAHPVGQLLATGCISIGESPTADTAIGLAADGCHLLDGLQQPLFVGGCCRLLQPCRGQGFELDDGQERRQDQDLEVKTSRQRRRNKPNVL